MRSPPLPGRTRAGNKRPKHPLLKDTWQAINAMLAPTRTTVHNPIIDEWPRVVQDTGGRKPRCYR
eukprot:877298-Lingulodinium_polyedra.AAC.1